MVVGFVLRVAIPMEVQGESFSSRLESRFEIDRVTFLSATWPDPMLAPFLASSITSRPIHRSIVQKCRSPYGFGGSQEDMDCVISAADEISYLHRYETAVKYSPSQHLFISVYRSRGCFQFKANSFRPNGSKQSNEEGNASSTDVFQ